jgi:PhzF family phenazine biosynthesis protein
MTTTAGIALSIVDAFTSTAFTGNPAAVCRLDAWPDDGWLQRVAAEMNLAETAFLVERDTAGEFDLRWFTPEVEVDLCGHATLAATHLLGRDGTLTFHTRSGALRCTRRADGCIDLDFPAVVSRTVPVDPRVGEALGATVSDMADGLFLLVELIDATTVRELHADPSLLRPLHDHGVIVTARGGPGEADVVSRVFVPNLGIDEDPVTGSAHCQLGPWWAARLGRDELRAEQASRRGGELQLRVVGDRVVLRGTAVTIVEGRLLAPPS